MQRSGGSGLPATGEKPDVLVHIAETGAEQADIPRNLTPQHEQGQRGKRAIDSIITRYPQLEMNVDVLHHLKGNAGRNTAYQGTLKPHLSIGHENVEKRHHQYHQGIRKRLDQHDISAADNDVILKAIPKRRYENGQATSNNGKQGQDEQQGGVVRNLTKQATLTIQLPNLVERLLNIVDQGKQGVKQQAQPHAHEYAPLGMIEVRKDKTNNRIGHGHLAG